MERMFLHGVILFFITTNVAQAFRVSPMLVEFEPKGTKATQTLFVENNRDKKIAVQVEAFHRLQDNKGKETRTPTDEFTIYPTQFILEAKEKRNIRVTWTGEPAPKAELPYRIVVGELPVEFKDQEEKKASAGSLKFLLEYVTSAYVKPLLAKAAVEATVSNLLNGKIELQLKNTGSAHQLLRAIKIKFVQEKDNTAWLPTVAELKQFEAENILPGHSRFFSFENVRNLSLPLKVEIKFEPL